jgi:hypothetical protein
MNRRTFLTSAGSSAAVAATLGLGRRRLIAQSSGSNPSVYSAATAAHAIASGNGLVTGANPSDWTTVGNTLQSVLSDWSTNNLDAQFIAALSGVSASMVTSANLPQQSILQQIQMFQPAFTLADVQNSLSFVDAQEASIPTVLSTLQQNGLSHYINIALSQSGLVATALSNTGGSANAMVTRPLLNRPFQPPSNPPGGGGYNCATDGALIFAAGLAFATLTVMTLGTAPVLVGAAWGAIAGFGGLASIGWGVGHVVAGCGF